MNRFNLKNRHKFNKKYIYIMIISIFIISVGFAYIQSTFSISGSAEIKNGIWNVHFANIQNINNYDLIDINMKISEKQKLINYNNTLLVQYNEKLAFLNSKLDTCVDDLPVPDTPVGPEDTDIPIEDPDVPLLDEPLVSATSDEEIYYCFELDLEINDYQYSIYSLQEEIENYLKPELEELNTEKNNLAPAITISDDGKAINIPLLLESKADFLEFEVDIINEGKYDAMVSDYTSSSLPDNLQSFLNFDATYLDGTTIQNNDLLAAGEKKTLKLKYSIKKEVDNIITLPNGTTQKAFTIPKGEFNITYEIPYIQATSEAVNRS